MLQINSDSIRIANAIENLDTANVPKYIIRINLHFVGHETMGNFYRGSKSDFNHANGIHWAELFINHINYHLDSLGTSKTAIKNFHGDARYNMKLYSNPANPKDSFGGIWFWDSGFRYKFPYGDSVLNVIFINEEVRKLNGSACGLNMCNSIVLYGAYDNVINKGIFGHWAFASLLNHEFGHVMGLCHSFYCKNECNGIDLDVQKECMTAPCYNDCGGPNYKACNNWDSGSTNMMGYNPDQNSLTPCQWKRIMHVLHTTKAKYVERKEPNTIKEKF